MILILSLVFCSLTMTRVSMGFWWVLFCFLFVTYLVQYSLSFLDLWFLCLTLILEIPQLLFLQIFLLPCSLLLLLIKKCYIFYTIPNFLDFVFLSHSFYSLHFILEVLIDISSSLIFFFGGGGLC